MPGNFLFALYSASKTYAKVPPTQSTLVALESGGKIRFERTIIALAVSAVFVVVFTVLGRGKEI